MPEFPTIRAYLDELAKTLGAAPQERERILAEAEDHLIEAAERLRAEGVARDEAERIAVARFGLPREVASKFAMERRSCARRSTSSSSR
jgi:hypothetical protein